MIATLGNFTLQAASFHNVTASSDSSGGGVVVIGTASTTTTTNDVAAATVGASSQITAGGNILVQSSEGVADSADANAAGGGLGVGSTATATTGGAAQAMTTVQNGANLAAAGNLQILATQGTGGTSTANAEAQGSGFGVHLNGNAYVTQVYNSDVVVQPGVNLSGPGLLQLTADVGTPVDTAIGFGNASAFGGVTDAGAFNTVSTHAKVEVAAGSPTTTMRTGTLLVTANDPGPVLTTQANRTTAFIDFGSGTATPLQPVNEGLIDFNANVTIGGASAILHIGSAGQVLAQSGATFTQTGTQIDVNPITNNTNGAATLTANSGVCARASPGARDFPLRPGYRLWSASTSTTPSKELVIPGISVLNPNQQVNLTISANDTTNFHATSNLTNSGGTPVTITNTSSSDVLLTGTINNPEGTTTVTNAGGNILSSGRTSSISTLRLPPSWPPSGSIGTAALPVNTQLVQSSFGTPTFTASASANDYLNLSALNLTGSALSLSP